jgi:hypothetical protein
MSFIALFFFTYVTDIEREVVLNNVNYIINELGGSLPILLDGLPQRDIIKSLDLVKLDDMKEADETVKKINDKIIHNSLVIFTSFFAVSLVICLSICIYFKLDIVEILSTNLLLLGGIALVEFVFVNFIIRNYISADINGIFKNILITIKKE